MPNQLLFYDDTVKSWIETSFGSLLYNKTLFLTIGTLDRAFGEYETPIGFDPDGRPPLPRAALTLGDPEIDKERFNPHAIRLLGYNSARNAIRRAEYPVPIRIPYTLNFWTEYRREMVVYQEKLLKLFKPGRLYLDTDVDLITPEPLYGTKQVGLFADSGVLETGDLEPGTKERITRRTFEFHLRGWLWDLDPIDVRAVKDIEVQYRDYDTEALFDLQRVPGRQTLFIGTGSQTSFAGDVDPDILPIVENTFLIDAVVGGSNVRGFDDGAGSISGAGISSGTVDYNTGAVTIEYANAPDDLTPIEVGYFTKVFNQ